IEEGEIASYAPAPEVAKIAEDLIPKHHEHLQGAPILYVFRDVAMVSRGKTIAAKARRVSGLNAFLVAVAAGTEDSVDHTFFVMEVAEDWWADASEPQRVALVDHELCHFGIDEEDEGPVLRIRAHDIEEFRSVVRRHGLWNEDVESFAAACGGA
ncbi:MAG: putative metallopeptidase, partial [Actinomycetota bacterium]